MLVLASTCVGQIVPQNSGDQTDSSNLVTERLSGVVLNSATAQPVPRVLVTSPGRPFAVLTDDQGRFQLDLTRPAEPAGVASSDRMLPISFQLRSPGYLTRASIISVPYYSSTQSPNSVELRITPAAAITGRVYTEGATIPPQYSATLYSREVVNGTTTWIAGQTAPLNKNGEFRFSDLRAGVYKVGSSDWNPTERGRQVDAPSVEGLASAFYPNAETLASAEPITLSAGQTATANLTLRTANFYRVTIPIVGERTEAVNTVLLPGSRDAQLSYDAGSLAVIGYVRPGAIGVRLFTTIPALRLATVHLQVTGAPLTLAPVTLRPAPQVTIYFRWEATAPAESRTVNAILVPLEPGGWLDNSRNTDRGTSPRVITVTDGAYDLLVHSDHAYVASAASGTTDLLQEPLVVTPGESPQPIEVALRNGPASLHVVVLDPTYVSALSGDTARPNQVYAIHVIALDEPRRGEVTQFSIATTALTSGTDLPNLAPGRYLVLASRQDEMTPTSPEYRNPEVMAGLMAKGAVVTLSASQNATVRVPVLAEEPR